MDVHSPKNGINRYWSIPIYQCLSIYRGNRTSEPTSNQQIFGPRPTGCVVFHPTEFSLVGKWPLHQQHIYIYIYISNIYIYIYCIYVYLYCVFFFVNYQRLPKAFCLLHCRCWKYDPKTCLTWLVGRHAIMLGDPPFKEKLLQVAALSHQILHTCLQNDGLKARRGPLSPCSGWA